MIDLLPAPEEVNAIGELAVAESRVPYGTSHTSEGYKSLRVYAIAMDLLVACYRLTADFPKGEQFGLTQQLRRAAVSITLNIAQGWGRNGKQKFARFADIARASAHEVDAALEIAIRLGYTTKSEASLALQFLNSTSSMLLRLTTALRKQT